jgi:hypothetical protein
VLSQIEEQLGAFSLPPFSLLQKECFMNYEFLGKCDGKEWYSCSATGNLFFKEGHRFIPLPNQKEKVDCANAPNKKSSCEASEDFLQWESNRSSYQVKSKVLYY